MQTQNLDPRRLSDVSWDEQTDEATFVNVLGEALDALDRASIPYGLLGGVASAVLGRPRWTHDIDIFLRADDAIAALDVLATAGFATQATNPSWIYKAVKDGVLVDLIFRAKGGIYLDEEMIARCQMLEFKGHRVKVIPPEDLIVIKAIIHDEDTPRHWYDALGIIAATELDWDYLLRRAQHGARRMLSLLVYAQSNDLIVPAEVIRSLSETIYAPRDS